MLRPLVVDSSGRSGTTMTMALLASSPQVAMDRQHPYEHFYFAWMAEWSRIGDLVEWNEQRWNAGAFAGLHMGTDVEGVIGPPPWLPRPLWEAEHPGDELGPLLLQAAWREFSERAVSRTRRELGAPNAEVLYHAEKVLSVSRLRQLSPIPVRAIVLHRDPRDVWLSVQAFDRIRGYYGFGRRADEDEQAWFDRFLAVHARRLRAVVAEREQADSLVLSYEELTSRPEHATARIAEWLGVTLDAAAMARELERHREHSTSASPEASVGRWRGELDAERVERFRSEMGAELGELGYAV